MSSFPIHTAETAPEGSRETLATVKAAWGMVPNLHGIMASSPELLKGYHQLWDLFGQTSFDATERQVVMMTTIYENECTYCMAGHSTLSKMQGIKAEVIHSLRSGAPIPDAKLEALRVFTAKVVRDRGFVGDAHLQALFAAGYTRQQALEVVLGVAVKTLSNYTNHIAHTPNDTFMAGNEWSKPGAIAS